jgi:hypothetical protein
MLIGGKQKKVLTSKSLLRAQGIVDGSHCPEDAQLWPINFFVSQFRKRRFLQSPTALAGHKASDFTNAVALKFEVFDCPGYPR